MVRQDLIKRYGPVAVLAVAYFLTAKLGLALVVVFGHVGSSWIPAGIALAALMMRGVTLWPGVAVGAFLANVTADVGPLSAAIMAVGATLEAVLATLALRRWGGNLDVLYSVSGVLCLMVLVAIGVSVVSASFGTAALLIGGNIGLESAPIALRTWLLGDALGIIFLTPFVLAWRNVLPKKIADIKHALLDQRALLALAPVLAAGITFTLPHGESALSLLLLLFIGPIAVVAALFAGPKAVTFANLCVAAIAVVATSNGAGPFTTAEGFQGALALQTQLYALAFTTLLVVAVRIERERAQALFSTLFRDSPVPVAISRLSDGRFFEANQACLAQFGFTREEVMGKTTLDLGVWEQASDRERLVERITKHGRVENLELRLVRHGGDVVDVLYSAQVVQFQGDACIIATIFDVTARKRADDALRKSEERFARVFHSSPEGILISRLEDGVFIDVNDAWEAMSGYSRSEALGESSLDLGLWHDPEDRERLMDLVRTGATVRNFEFKIRRKDGVVIDAHLSGEMIQENGVPCLLGLVSDITERKQSDLQLRESERRFADVLEAAGEYVWENDTESRYTFISARVTKVLGYSPEEMLGRKPAEFMAPEEAERMRKWLDAHYRPGEPFQGAEHMSITKDGRTIWQLVSGVPVFAADGTRLGDRGTGLDITERKRAEQRIDELATRDSLTQLPNRRLLMDRLSQSILTAQRNHAQVGVLFIDLDRFKTINDSLGHAAGDALLREVSVRLAELTRKGDTLARLGGDEFVIVLDSLRAPEDAGAVAQKLIAAISEPFYIDGRTLNTSTSVGVSVFPTDAEEGATLLRNADMAMYFAKEHGRQNYQFYSEEMNSRAVEKLAMESTLRRAVDNGELELYYHPKFRLADGKLMGAEALLRWHHPELGLVTPDRFIPVAEESGLIAPIGEWVLERACRQGSDWQSRAGAAMTIAVNLSVSQINKSLPRTVHDALSRTGFSPGLLELEITESLLMKNVDEHVEALRQLSELGVAIAIDDFGTGYSSLAYLRRLRVDTLKIDQSFVRDVETSLDAAAIIEAIVALGRSLKLIVVAEGVENANQKRLLEALNCDHGQGFLFCAPLPAHEFEKRFFVEAEAVAD